MKQGLIAAVFGIGMVMGGGIFALAQGVFTVVPTLQWDAVSLKLGNVTQSGVNVTATKFTEGDIVCFRFFETPSQTVHYTCTR
jgi:hypothetical protein